MKQFYHFVQNNRLLVILYEDIISNPLECIQYAYNFLGVSKDFIPGSLNSRPQEVLYNLTRLKLITFRNRFLYDYNEDRTRSIPRKKTPADKIIAGAFTILDRNLLSIILPNNKPTVSLELRKILYEQYASDIESLAGFINRDLSGWKL